jgi:hypothetical protein
MVPTEEGKVQITKEKEAMLAKVKDNLNED